MPNAKKVKAVSSASQHNELGGSPPIPETCPASQGAVPNEGPALSFPIVGIGASAGGLEVFTKLLKNLPKDTGMAFVFVQHLSPDHASALPEILSRATAMPVTEITDGNPVLPNQVYVIPPHADLALEKGCLKLTPRSDTRTPPHPIDHFFQSLAQDQGDCSVGIILSGTANDGTAGLKFIKEAGGITFAQDESAQYDSMPQSAVASGVVDLVLNPTEIANELGRISRTPYMAWAQTLRPNAVPTERPPEGGVSPLNALMALLRNKMAVDFTLYKPATIQRRITRRMVLNKKETLADYLSFLRENPLELQALYQDLLINVTSFFRDPEAFDLLKYKVFPKLLEQRGQDDPIRVWVVGCSTGQEVYSIIMSYLEVAGDSKVPFKIFATDVNESALEQARAGLYTRNAVQELSPQRLRRFFVETEGGYQINKSIRECCVFARHNVINDPPFSRIDLISCRNLLIYLKPVLQKKVLPMFHYAAKPQSFLLLGTSESIGDSEDLFAVVNRKYKLFSRKPGPSRAHLAIPLPHHEIKMGIEIPEHREHAPPRLDPQKEADRVLLTRYVPAGVLITADLEIIQFRGETGAYLEPAPGKPSHNLLKMARGGLLLPLRELIEKAKKNDVPTSKEGVRLEQPNGFLVINLEIIPLRNLPATERCFLVLFHPVNESSQQISAPDIQNKDTLAPRHATAEADEIARLKLELAELKDYLQSVIEQHEAADEELQAASEETQSSNEELQSINEELETSKEEIQATNEELTTMNEEFNNRNIEARRLNDDLNNLLNSVAISVVIAGTDFRIRRFTPTAEKMLHVKSGDIGRPLTEIRLGLLVPDLENLMQEVIETISPREREVRDDQNCWYLLRIIPYITVERKIDGVVLVFTDVNALKQSELQIKEARDYAESILRTAPNPLLVLGADLRVESVNQAFYDTFKTNPAESEGRLIYELGNGQWNIPLLRELLEKILPEHSVFNDYEVTHTFENIGQCTMVLNARRLDDRSGHPSRIVLGIQDITRRKQAEEVLRLKQEQLADHNTELEAAVAERTKSLTAANQELEQFSYTITHDMRAPLRAMRGYGDILLNQSAGWDPESKVFLERINNAAVRMDRLILDALNYTKLVREEIELVPVDCGALLCEMIDSYPQFKESIGTFLIQGTLPVVLGNDAALTQCFSNLLNNAIKFVKPGNAPELRIWAEDITEGQNSKNTVRIWFEDKGIGIPKEAQERIFTMFQQVTADDEGTGIGLALVRKAAERMGGRVGVESELGVGSRFWIDLKKALK